MLLPTQRPSVPRNRRLHPRLGRGRFAGSLGVAPSDLDDTEDLGGDDDYYDAAGGDDDAGGDMD